MRVALVRRIVACAALLTLSALGRPELSARANETPAANDGPRVCPPTAYLAATPEAENACPPCAEAAEDAPRLPRLFSRWRLWVRNHAATDQAPPAHRQVAERNAAGATDVRAGGDAGEHVVNFEAPLPEAECCEAECEAAECEATACQEAACAAGACAEAACACPDAHCACCKCTADGCCACADSAACGAADACQDSACACACHAAECAAEACPADACAACICPDAACAAGACCAEDCVACPSCPACAGECGSACSEPVVEGAPAPSVLGEPSPEQMAAEILELMQRLGPGALDGTVFESPEGEALDAAAAEAARAALREEMAGRLRWLAEEHLALQQAVAAQDAEFVVPVAPPADDATALQQACRILEETAQALEEQRLFDAADQVRAVAAQLRQTARGLAGSPAARVQAGATSIRSARRPAAPGRAGVEGRRQLQQTRQMPSLR